MRDLKNIGIELVLQGLTNRLLLALEVKPSIVEEIKSSQNNDAKLERLKQNVTQGKSFGFMIYEDETWRF